MKAIGIILLLCIIAINSKEEILPLFDLNYLAEQGTLGSFLANLKEDGFPVTSSVCMEEKVFKKTQLTIDPSSIQKGKSIKIKVVGAMLQASTVQKLHLDTYYNGGVIFTADVDQKNVEVKKGSMWGYNYEASVPTFTPAGKWEIFVYVINSANEKIHCVKCEFETS